MTIRSIVPASNHIMDMGLLNDHTQGWPKNDLRSGS
jgi:hypothetical protein